MLTPDEAEASNRSDNPEFADIVQARFSRRNLLLGGMSVAAVGFLSGCHIVDGRPVFRPTPGTPTRLLGFTGVAPSTADEVVVPRGYTSSVLIPWGTPIVPSGPAWRKDASNTAAEQAQQIGMHHDGMWYFPFPGADGNRRGLLVVNHEYTDDHLLFPDGEANWTAAKTEKSMAAHGVSVVEVQLVGDRWQVVESRYARRFTGATPMQVSGPAAGHRLLRTASDPTGRVALGTLNNCAMGHTPWGTYLTCEENFNGYFWNETADSAPAGETKDLHRRYGVAGKGFDYLWATTHERFRADLHPNEPNKYGWVVEIDPFAPTNPAIKRTALGRMKHEGAWVVEARDGRAVVYMGDDERGEYVFKFVSESPWRAMIARGISPLEHGTLHVARFDASGHGHWLPLVAGQGPLTAANGFADQGDVVVKARLAGDRLGATKMDRPEWGTVDTRDGHVYMTMTNNTRRTAADAANPRSPNPWGHIVRWTEDGGDHGATSFHWEIFVLAGKGDGTDGSTVTADAAFGSPDGLWCDPDGRLWIQTDGTQPVPSNDQMLAADTETGEIRRFLVGVRGCEVTGITTTPDRRWMFVNIQHPGDEGTPENPTAQSSWPDRDPAGRPRAATVVIRKQDGGIIGS